MSALTSSHWIPDGSGQPLLEGVTVGSRLREVAAEVPDRVALVEGLPTPDRRQWTYAKLLDDAECCARLLLQYFEPGEHVAVWAHNLPEWVLLEYGASLAGLTLVTVNPSLQPAEVSYILGQSRAAGLFLVPEVRGNPLTAHIESIRADLPNLRHVLRLDLLDELVADNAGRDVALPADGPMVALIEEATGAAPTVGLLRLAAAGVTLIETRIQPTSAAANHVLADVPLPPSTVVAALIRDGEPTVPDPDHRLQPGDVLLVVTHTATEQDIQTAFQ